VPRFKAVQGSIKEKKDLDQNLNSDETFIIRKAAYVLGYTAIISYPLHKKKN
jgi:hypothetical protein